MPMVAVEPGREVLGALGGGVVSVCVGSFAQLALDEAFGFAVPPRRFPALRVLAALVPHRRPRRPPHHPPLRPPAQEGHPQYRRADRDLRVKGRKTKRLGIADLNQQIP